MDTEAALLAAIAANPDDDLPRLVYADWLDENDRPLRAEFIRLQIEIAHKEILSRAVVDLFSHLWKRQQEILDGHTGELLGPLAGILQPLNYEFRRGFLEWVQLTLRDFLNSQAALEPLVPMPEVRVSDATVALDELVTAPHAGLIRELNASRDDPYLGDGFWIVMTSELRDVAPLLTNLNRLLLTHCYLGDDGVNRVFTPGGFPALNDLDLSFNDLTDQGVIDLLDTGLPQRLKKLFLGGNPIGDRAAVALAERLGPIPTFEHLNLRYGTNIGRVGQAAILNALGGPRADLF
jgi:uncharacterized protein (TIGR02996 family)